MMKGRIIPLILAAVISASCATAPISSGFLGRSYGKGRVAVDGGAIAVGSGIPYFKFGYGLSSNLDLGIQYDFLSLGLFGRYSFINSGEGFSLAGLLSGGSTANGSYLYAGPALSFKTGFIEPYIVSRYNYVHYKESKSQSGIQVDAGNYDYLQIAAGSVLWISPSMGANIEFNFLSGNTGSADFIAPLILGGLKIRF